MAAAEARQLAARSAEIEAARSAEIEAEAAEVAEADPEQKEREEERTGGSFASVVVLGGGLGRQGASHQGKLCPHFPDLRRDSLGSRGGGEGGNGNGNGGLLQHMLQQVSSGGVGQVVSSGLNFLLGNGNGAAGGGGGAVVGGGATLAPVTDAKRPRLWDVVRVLKQTDAHVGQLGKVVQDDRDAQPYRLLIGDGALSDVFYRPSEVAFHKRGERPFLNDRVVASRPTTSGADSSPMWCRTTTTSSRFASSLWRTGSSRTSSTVTTKSSLPLSSRPSARRGAAARTARRPTRSSQRRRRLGGRLPRRPMPSTPRRISQQLRRRRHTGRRTWSEARRRRAVGVLPVAARWRPSIRVSDGSRRS